MCNEKKEEKTPPQAAKGGLGLALRGLAEGEAAWVPSHLAWFLGVPASGTPVSSCTGRHLGMMTLLSPSKSYKEVGSCPRRNFCSKRTTCFPGIDSLWGLFCYRCCSPQNFG